MYYSDIALSVLNAKFLNRWVIFIIDLFFSVSATITSQVISSFILSSESVDTVILILLLTSTVASSISFLSCRTYKGFIRHSAFTETGHIAMGCLLKVACIIPIAFTLTAELTFRGMLLTGLIDLFLTFFILTIIRVLLILTYSLFVNISNSYQGKLLIYINNVSMTFINEGTLWNEEF